jgi:hypothetical protein
MSFTGWSEKAKASCGAETDFDVLQYIRTVFALYDGDEANCTEEQGRVVAQSGGIFRRPAGHKHVLGLSELYE